ncbi:zinc-ribbon and DUF3426 domain-containing protein [Methylibium sp.]|uniref:zinc-ribbon and DUF3426 domain-containing protein n=1 Tax=Methylibium sp. TaxID=2067992 RepID=UPI003BA8BFCD
MSLATRCTACGTIFRVVQDQLKVSEGWVRCGRCEETFNALEGLFDLEREAPPQRTPKASATQSVVEGMAEFVASHHPGSSEHGALAAVPATQEHDAIESRFFAPQAVDSRSDEYPDFADARFPSEFPNDAAAPDQEAAEGDADVSPPPPADTKSAKPSAPLLQRWRDSRAARQAAAMSSLLEAPIGDEASTPPPPVAPAIAGTPGFLRQAEDAARWRRPRVRASLVVATALLVGTLLTQIAVQYRDAFAAQWPQARPTLETLCEVLDCRIEPLRRLAAITVESSGLTQVEGSDAYRLSLTLHNRGQVDIALPSIDLTVTDNSGTLISRRALAPADFRTATGGAVPGVALAPGSESQLQALMTARGARISGYTVELFYP